MGSPSPNINAFVLRASILAPRPSFTFEFEEDWHSTDQFLNARLSIDNPVMCPVAQVIVHLRGIGYIQLPDAEDYQEGEQRLDDDPRNETLLSMVTSVLGDGSYMITLPKGSTTYRCSFDIRYENLSSSCETKFGAIRYSLSAAIIYPSGRVERANPTRITVIRPLDLTLDAELAQPKCTTVGHGPGILSCWSGRISGHLEVLRKSGFVPGETINFRVSIENNSSRALVGLEVVLKRVIRLLIDFESVELPQTIGEFTWPMEEVAQWEDGDWTSASLNVPGDAPPTDVRREGMVHVSYCLSLMMRIRGRLRRRLIFANIPIVIGTTPIRSPEEILDEPLVVPEPELDNLAPPSVVEPTASTPPQASA